MTSGLTITGWYNHITCSWPLVWPNSWPVTQLQANSFTVPVQILQSAFRQNSPCNKILTCWIFYGKLQKHCFLPLAHRKIFWYHSPLRDKVKCATIWRQDVIKIKSNTSVEQWWPTFTLYFLLSSVVLKNHLPLALSLLHRHTFCNSQPRRSAVPEHPMTQRDPKSLSLAACLLNWDK